jgi:hypothetical protein
LTSVLVLYPGSVGSHQGEEKRSPRPCR